MMGRKRVLISVSLLFGLWFALTLSLSSQVTERPADVSELTSRYLAVGPVIDNEPAYTVGTENVIFWSHVSDPDLIAYRIQASLAPSFNTVWQSRVVPKDWDSTTFAGLPLDTMWYRVQAAFVPTADTFWSAWSQSTFSVQDVEPPATGCEITEQTDPNLWSTQDSITINYNLSDPAGIDSVLLYRRVGDSGPWTMFNGSKPVGAPTDVIESVEFSSSLDLQGDNQYQFYIGGRDDAKAPNWQSGDNPSFGNAIRPIPSSSAMCEIKIDTRLPESDIDTAAGFDSLYTTRTINIPYWAHDSIPTFHSGLDSIYLFWGVDSGAISPTGTPEETGIDSFIVLGGGGDHTTGNFIFSAPFDTSIYYFYTVAVDVAGNRQIDTVIHKTRVFTTMEATLVLYDPSDPKGDSTYTSECQVDVVLRFNVPAVDSFVLCEDADFLVGCTVVRQQIPGPIETTWTFADCSDGEKWLYARVFVGDTSVIAEWSIVLDTTKPVLNELILFNMSSQDRAFTEDRLVGVDFRAVELPLNELQWLVLSEDADFTTPDTIFLNTDDDTVFTLSEGFERKTVYGYLVDRAENVSADTLSESIMLFEHPHNYPNPFNPDVEHTNMVFTLGSAKTVTILIYDLFGNLVYESSVAATAGLNDGVLTWDGHNMQNQPVASGGYICLLKAGDREISRHKIAVIR